MGVVGRPQHRDEDVGATFHSGRGVEHRHRIAGKIDEQLLGGPMYLAHGRRDRAPPSPIKIAEKPAVAIAVGVLGPVFLPQQQQRHGASLQLRVDVGMGVAGWLLVESRRREQPPLKLGVGEALRTGV